MLLNLKAPISNLVRALIYDGCTLLTSSIQGFNHGENIKRRGVESNSHSSTESVYSRFTSLLSTMEYSLKKKIKKKKKKRKKKKKNVWWDLLHFLTGAKWASWLFYLIACTALHLIYLFMVIHHWLSFYILVFCSPLKAFFMFGKRGIVSSS